MTDCNTILLDTDIDSLKLESNRLKESVKAAIMKFKEATGFSPSMNIEIKEAQLRPCSKEEIVSIKIDIKVPI